MNDFFSMSTEENNSYLEILRLCFALELLVLLYMSPVQDDRLFAAGVIIHILKLSRIDLTEDWCNKCAFLVLRDTLYLSGRSTLGLLPDISSWFMYGEDTKGASLMKEIFSFVSELGNGLCQDLVAFTESPWSSGPFFGDFCDFKAFLLPLHTVIKRGPSADPILKRGYVEASDYLYATFLKLLRKMNECLFKMQDCLPLNRTWGDVTVWRGWFHYLAILEELQKISEHYKLSLCVLLVKYLKPTDNIRWLLEHKNEYGYEFRRHMAREIQNEDFQRSLKMVIDRFLNKATSFTNVEGHQMLPGDLFTLPRVQEDNPPDIMEKWFLSMCQAIFNPQNALFMASPSVPTQVYPNPVIKLENLHLKYSSLADKLIALCLIHKVPIGVVFDLVFFLQLPPDVFFFHCLELEDLDWMLQGVENSVSLADLKANASDKRRHVITNWEKGRLSGCGLYESVYEGYAPGDFFYAVKKQCIYQIEQEIALLIQFNHPNIVQYYGTDKDETKLYIFLELASNGFLAEIYSRYHLKDSQVAAYTRQILHGLKYLHQRNVIHRDIKCANILVNVGGTVKLVDFGLAKMAPEVVNLKRRGYGLPADIWSLGCTVLEMLIRKRPYSHLEPAQVLSKIGRGEPAAIPEFLSSLSQDFILQCLQVNPDDRPTAAKLLDHPFVKRSLHP
ncbi:hypothetical protein P3X46_032131 [Hevea brasiliensis]|uniref:Protein kinase domain-containing protein n=1 Tax=Hevea brasiliensis TaxID=3981 RepID=A0ABQ9KE72_HEVBR|nr:hypothetical protein P3X46_032131 [Hevea brasiliensis]